MLFSWTISELLNTVMDNNSHGSIEILKNYTKQKKIVDISDTELQSQD